MPIVNKTCKDIIRLCIQNSYNKQELKQLCGSDADIQLVVTQALDTWAESMFDETDYECSLLPKDFAKIRDHAQERLAYLSGIDWFY